MISADDATIYHSTTVLADGTSVFILGNRPHAQFILVGNADTVWTAIPIDGILAKYSRRHWHSISGCVRRLLRVVAVAGCSMNLPRFTIRNLLVGTAWFSVWATLLHFYKQMIDDPTPLLLPYLLIAFLTPFVAVGATLGNSLKGAVVGVCVIFLLYVSVVILSIVAVVLSRAMG